MKEIETNQKKDKKIHYVHGHKINVKMNDGILLSH